MIPQEPDIEPAEPATPPRQVDPRAFRDHLGCFPTGVTIITRPRPARAALGGDRHLFNSVSLDPPLVLFALDRRAYSLWTSRLAISPSSSWPTTSMSRRAASPGR